MPLLDDAHNAIGCVLVESKETGNYTRSFMLINFTNHKLRFYPEEAECASDLSIFEVLIEINCQYITKVGQISCVLTDVDLLSSPGQSCLYQTESTQLFRYVYLSTHPHEHMPCML